MPLDLGRWDVAALTHAWANATPFPHVVIDGAVTADELTSLQHAVAQEGHLPERTEIVDTLVSSPTPRHPTLSAFAASMGSAEARTAIEAITGKRVAQVDLRSYVYVAGGYLLPHTDHRSSNGRQVAFALYLGHPVGCFGGELVLFRCTIEGDELTKTEPARTIAYQPNRLVLFDVSDVSLHQIREVTDGVRVSLAGWFR